MDEGYLKPIASKVSQFYLEKTKLSGSTRRKLG
jgi:hypothetical protein